MDKKTCRKRYKEMISKGQVNQTINEIKELLKASTTEEQTSLYNLLGEAYMNKGSYPEALKCLYQAIKLAEDLGDFRIQVDSYIVLAILHVHIHDVEEAMKIQKYGLEISEKHEIDDLTNICYNNLACMYGEIEDFNQSIFYIDKVLATQEEDGILKDTSLASSALLNKGENCMRLGRLEEATTYFLEAEKMSKKIDYTRNIATAYYNLSEICRKEKKYKEAINYMDQALEKYIELGLQKQELECYEQLSELFEIMKDYKEAFVFLKCYKDISETILDEKTRKSIQKIKLEYERKQRKLAKKQARELEVINRDLIQLNNELKKANEEIKHLSMYDYLTHTLNRRGFREEIQRSQGYRMMLLDIDNFKSINDTYGHNVGDTVLAACAQVLNNVIGDQGKVGRFGGEEFVIGVEQGTEKTFIELAEHLCKTIGNTPVQLEDGLTLNYTVTIGLSCEWGKALDQYIKIADQNLYKGKKSTKACVVY